MRPRSSKTRPGSSKMRPENDAGVVDTTGVVVSTIPRSSKVRLSERLPRRLGSILARSGACRRIGSARCCVHPFPHLHAVVSTHSPLARRGVHTLPHLHTAVSTASPILLHAGVSTHSEVPGSSEVPNIDRSEVRKFRKFGGSEVRKFGSWEVRQFGSSEV